MGALADQLRRHEAAKGRLWSGKPPAQARPSLSPRVSPFIRDLRKQRQQEVARLRETARQQKHWSAIVREVASKHRLVSKDLTGRDKRDHVVLARQEAMWRLRNEVVVVGKPMTMEAIGKRFHKHHTTVLHSLRMFEQRLSSGEVSVPGHTVEERGYCLT